jgi:ketosteroid isomerase-like protein
MNLEDRVKRLEDRDKIRETVYNYVHGMDKRNVALFRTLWTDDARYVVDPPFSTSSGVDAIAATLEGFHLVFSDLHHHTTNLVIDGPHGDVASTLSDVLVTGTDAEGVAWTSACTYHDKLRRVGDDWRFTERHVEIHYMVTWLEPQSIDSDTRLYLTPEHAEHLVGLAQRRRAETAVS